MDRYQWTLVNGVRRLDSEKDVYIEYHRGGDDRSLFTAHVGGHKHFADSFTQAAIWAETLVRDRALFQEPKA